MPSAVREMMEVTDEGIAMADSDVNLNMNNCDDGCATFDVQRFLRGLDAIFDAHKAPEQAEPYLQKARTEAEHSHDDVGLLTVLNETMGFYRSQGRHTDNLPIIRESLSIADHLHLQEINPQTWATTLINAATGMRAAGQYEEAEQLYRQALDTATSAFSPTDRRLAALHNNMSMLYSEPVVSISRSASWNRRWTCWSNLPPMRALISTLPPRTPILRCCSCRWTGIGRATPCSTPRKR